VKGLNPTDLLPGDLILNEGLDGRHICIFLQWDDSSIGRCLILDRLGVRFFWYEKEPVSYEKWWVIGRPV
jgi:hypothetical protein